MISVDKCSYLVVYVGTDKPHCYLADDDMDDGGLVFVIFMYCTMCAHVCWYGMCALCLTMNGMVPVLLFSSSDINFSGNAFFSRIYYLYLCIRRETEADQRGINYAAERCAWCVCCEANCVREKHEITLINILRHRKAKPFDTIYEYESRFVLANVRRCIYYRYAPLYTPPRQSRQRNTNEKIEVPFYPELSAI